MTMAYGIATTDLQAPHHPFLEMGLVLEVLHTMEPKRPGTPAEIPQTVSVALAPLQTAGQVIQLNRLAHPMTLPRPSQMDPAMASCGEIRITLYMATTKGQIGV